METSFLGKIFQIIWSLFAICGGLILLLLPDWFISSNSRAFLKLYKKTKFPLFKYQAEEIKRDYMRVLVFALGAVSIVAGILMLLGKLR